MDWLEGVEHWLIAKGVPEHLVRRALIPFCLLLGYLPIYEAFHAFDIEAIWAHSLTAFLLLAVPWLVFAPHIFRNAPLNYLVLQILSLCLACLLPFLWIIYGRHELRIPFFVAALVLLAVALSSRWPATIPRLLQLYGVIFLGSAALSVPAFVEWLRLPEVTSYGRVGVLVAQFELDPSGQTQAGVIGDLAREFNGDPALRQIIDLKQLRKPIERKPDDPFGEKRLKEAIEIGQNSNAGIVIFGIATTSPQKRIDLVVASVDPDLIERQNWDIAIDTGQLDLGTKLIHFLAKIIGGQTHLILGNCVAAESFLRDAENQLELGPQTKALGSKIQLWEAHSIMCDAEAKHASASRIHEAIKAYERAANATDTEVHSLAKLGLGRSYRVLSAFENPSKNLELSIGAYTDALADLPPDAKRSVSAAARTGLGVAYEKAALQRGEKDAKTYLHRAVDEHRKALALIAADQPEFGRVLILNNLGVALMKLAGSGEAPAKNLHSAIGTLSDASGLAQSRYVPSAMSALIKGNLGDAYVDLSFQEDQRENLNRGAAELEEALAKASPNDQPLIFAENAYKAGIANMLLYGLDRGRSELIMRGLGEIACSTALFGRAGDRKAQVAAKALKSFSENHDKAGGPKFKETLASALKPEGCDYKVDDVLVLMQKYAGAGP